MKAVRHFGIVVRDMEKSLAFYRDLLGLKIEKSALESGNYLDKILGYNMGIIVRTVKMSAESGPTLVELLQFHNPESPPGRSPVPFKIGPTHIAFTVANLNEIYDRLLADGVPFTCKPLVAPGGKAKVTFCKDPDGTLIELVEELDKAKL